MPGLCPAFFFIFMKKMLTRSDAIAAPFYQGYLDQVGEDNVVAALKKSGRQFREFLETIPPAKINFAYAPNKWTIKEVLQHIIDGERVFSYRALSFARKDPTPLPGFDENNWAAHSQAAAREWSDLLDEFRAVRKSTRLLFGAFNDEQLLAAGVASGNPINNLALGYICSGHVLHHMQIIKERYL